MMVMVMMMVSFFNVQLSYADFESAIKKISKQKGEVSVLIAELESGKPIFELNADLPVNPASCSKLFTGAAALQTLGLQYQYETKVYASKKAAPDLCIQGSGDPSFVMEDMYLLVQGLKRKGLTQYSGKITLDASVFDQELIPEDRTDAQSERAYNSPIAGLNFNYNTITTFVNSGLNPHKGSKAITGLDFDFPFVSIQSTAKVGKNTDIAWNKAVKNGKEVVTLGGTIAAQEDSEFKKPFRITQPVRAFGEALASLLSQSNIQPAQKVSIQEGACSGQEIYTHTSKPLSQIVQLMNKYSNNFIADALVKTLSSQRPGSMKGGLEMIRAELSKIGIVMDKSRAIVSGSGLTKGNLFSASDFLKLFRYLNTRQDVYPEFLTSLPIAGRDGTLKRKYNKTPIEGKLRAKTGSLNGVQALVGVYPRILQQGHAQVQWVFVAVLINGGASIPEAELAQYLGKL